jgi:SAM-dependent methyltransferase
MDQRLMKVLLDVDEHHWWYRGRRRIVRAELDRLPLPTGARILDAGCGSGRMLQELAGYGQASGIELDEDAAGLAAQRGHGEVKVGRLEELPWEDATFDLITSLDVVEHTPDDREALTELRRVSKPGGWLLLTVPAYQTLWSLHDVANHHFRRYNRATLAAPARAAGWQMERMTFFNSLPLAPAAVVRLAQRRKRLEDGYKPNVELGPPWLNSVFDMPMRAEARWLSRGRRLSAGLSLLALLRNPGP